MHRNANRTCTNLIRRLVLLCALAMGVALPALAGAMQMVDTLVIKYRDDGSASGATSVPAGDLGLLGHLHKSMISNLGRTRDGALRVALDPPLAS